MGGTGGYQDLSDFESVPPKMGGTQASCEKRWYPPEWGVLGGTQGVLFSDGGY